MLQTWLITATIVSISISLSCLQLYAAETQQDNVTKLPPPAAQSAAEDGLKIITRPKADDAARVMEAQALGFRSSEEKAHAKLGEPLSLILVTSKQLSNSQIIGDHGVLLRQIQQAKFFIYPLNVGKEVRSSLTIRQSRTDQAQWGTVLFGAANLIASIDKYRKESNANFVLWISGLNRYFLGRLSQKELLLIPIVDEPRLGFVAGQVISGDEVFSKLKPQAEAFYKNAQNKKLDLDKKLDKQRPASSR